MFTGKLNTELNTAKKSTHTLQKVPTQHIVFPFPTKMQTPGIGCLPYRPYVSTH